MMETRELEHPLTEDAEMSKMPMSSSRRFLTPGQNPAQLTAAYPSRHSPSRKGRVKLPNYPLPLPYRKVGRERERVESRELTDAGSERRLREEVGVIHEAVMGLIRSRRKERALLLVNGNGVGGGGGARSDLLSRMIECGYPDEAIRDMVISFIMAGRDTTSSALTWFFWLLMRHRGVEAQVLDEIAATRRARGAGEEGGDDGEGEGLDLDDYRRMRVLHAALCETMRLYPPVAWDSKHAAADDVLPDGTAVGRGDRVTYFQYGMGRMEAIWGADAADFSLDRWLSLPLRSPACRRSSTRCSRAGRGRASARRWRSSR